MNLKVIMQRTNTTIIFPDAGDPNIPPIKKGSVTISGAIHNVYLARQLLLGSLPIVMMFDLPEGIDVQESLIQRLQDENEVTISVKPKARQANKSVIIKTQERNVGGMYVARHKLLDLEDEVVRAEVPETYKVPLVGSSSTFHMASLPANRGPYMNLAQHHMVGSCGGSPLSPTCGLPPPVYGSGRFAAPMTPTSAVPPNLGSPWQLSTSAHMMPPPPNPPNTPVNGDVGRLPPNHHFLQDYALMVFNNMNKQQQQQGEHGLHHLQQQHKEEVMMEQQRVKTSVQWCSPPQQNLSHMGPSSSGLGSSVHSSPILSPRNSSPVTAAGNLTNNIHKMVSTQRILYSRASNSSLFFCCVKISAFFLYNRLFTLVWKPLKLTDDLCHNCLVYLSESLVRMRSSGPIAINGGLSVRAFVTRNQKKNAPKVFTKILNFVFRSFCRFVLDKLLYIKGKLLVASLQDLRKLY